MAEAWLAWLRMNQGRPAESLRLVRQATGKGLAAYRFPNAYGGMVATMALAMLGRVDEALATLDVLEGDVARMGAHRWTPRPLNLRGWIVRNLGEFGQADELNWAAIDAARSQGLDEPLANGLLDLASGRLLAGDVDGADGFLSEAMPFTEIEHAFRWRHQLRGRLIRARLDWSTHATSVRRRPVLSPWPPTRLCSARPATRFRPACWRSCPVISSTAALTSSWWPGCWLDSTRWPPSRGSRSPPRSPGCSEFLSGRTGPVGGCAPCAGEQVVTQRRWTELPPATSDEPGPERSAGSPRPPRRHVRCDRGANC